MYEIKMPTECTANPLQRELADSIIRFSPLDDLRILIACGASPNDPVTQGLRPLHYAVWQRYLEAVQFLLVRGSDVNARDDCGYTALHLSAEHGYTEIMSLLLEYQAKVNFSDKMGEETGDAGKPNLCDEPLHLAIKNGHYEAARLLLENGANVNTRYFFGCEISLISALNPEAMELLLMYGAYPDSRDRSGLTPLMKACRNPQATETVLKLISYGADVNAQADERNDYRSVLHYAVLSGNRSMVSLLLKQGARVQPPPGDPALSKPSVLDLAVLKGDVELVRMLIEAGADVNNTSSILGSALHVACADNVANRADIVRLLLENGANPNIAARSDEGLPHPSVLAEYVTSNGNRDKLDHEVVDLLLRHGAQVVLKTQHRHPLGLYSIIPILTRHPRVFLNVMDAAESFDNVMLKRLNNVPPDFKQIILDLAMQPLSLQQQCRFYLRQQLQPNIHLKIPLLEIPTILQSFLLFEIS
ncbi:Ankyrin repeat domain-containing protein [Daphnia magna]|uniref:Ankyrin repeat domain-containing protein n=1 Tax=Daphnia magna TaxID=35525 RepID=A0A0P5DYT9_9CRUS|nr:Ankyrin repeat domain-containing protein [Daphnia magna]